MWVDETINNDGVAIATRDYGGDGRALIFIHGGPGQNLATWDEFAPMLDADVRAIALDMRGNGASGDALDYSYPALASDIQAVVHRYQIARPIIVGHSWGGQLATYYASQHRACAGVVGIDGWITDVRPELSDDVWRWMEESYASDPLLRFTGKQGRLEAMLDRVAEDYSASAAHVLRRQFVQTESGVFKRRRSAAQTTTIQRVIDDHSDVLKSELYANITCPVLLIGAEQSPGDRDARLLPWAFSRLATAPIIQRFKNVREVWLPCGHDIPHEMPRELAQLLTDFVAELE
jgi:pimeloyl-ACP methyl ester carboxylesterase